MRRWTGSREVTGGSLNYIIGPTLKFHLLLALSLVPPLAYELQTDAKVQELLKEMQESGRYVLILSV
jgi:hypothetical protein